MAGASSAQAGRAMGAAGAEHAAGRRRERRRQLALQRRDLAPHAFVRHGLGAGARDPIHINATEGYFSIFRRGMPDIYLHCAKTHLHRHAAEFEFRYSNRSASEINDLHRLEITLRGSVGKRLLYRDLFLA